MNYKILLFDLDDTLLDFAANEQYALKHLFEESGITFTKEVFDTYSRVNKDLWAAYEKGEIPLEEVLNTRFSKALLSLGKEADGRLWEQNYRERLGNGHEMLEGAAELIKRLSGSFRMFIVTNGVTETQIKRLKQSGLYSYFEDIFTSQAIGYQKPAAEFFDYVKSHVKDFDAESTLIIGDSLSSDIKGGNLAGIDTCWLNRNSAAPSADIISTYSIKNLYELLDIVGA
ncbi:YjjG family noncanonical pyrimidine nucleotidase [Anaerocolumna sp. AGMB13020]|uniref:YjjG family noncanonical pyrimidine nucleotidase n=1 Tax=Anaerocolumna sp. AGMB13020 TaxID=3081750 RepID=UPI002955353A|nr:YjjG family noncanonical pyrimidine nucleotidase [Anaerocolumna sp. AGMB13020]WOO36778.1 YjjG family noncanonical pyrimidine nucleotidase [Anaerocolumna sp. AGMB13020]